MDLADYRELVRQVAYEQAKLSTSSFFFDGQDRLRLRTFGSLAGVILAVEGRLLGADGRLQAFAETHTPASDRTVATSLYHLVEGFLLNVSLRASTGAPRVGQVFAILEVVRGIGATVQPLAVIFQGYVTDTSTVGWPGSPLRASIDGLGVIRSIIGTNPAAGAEVSETVPTNARWRLRSLAASFVTSATAASRYPSLIFDDGATNFYVSDPPELQLASTTSTWQAFPGSARLVAVSGVRQWNAGVPICLQGGFRLRTATTNLQAGDDWGAPTLLVEEWIED